VNQVGWVESWEGAFMKGRFREKRQRAGAVHDAGARLDDAAIGSLPGDDVNRGDGGGVTEFGRADEHGLERILWIGERDVKG